MENALLKNSVYFWSNLPDTPYSTPGASWGSFSNGAKSNAKERGRGAKR
jgi:hypothetical protein